MAAEGVSELSGHDYNELKAFNEKRIWFEARLKLLEELPAISPFAALAQDGFLGDSTTVGTTKALVGLSYQQLAHLQKERDALEQEVHLFDDGDLVRMKEKTRVVTLSPLTPPSTELVSITLALIVVVDNLLTLLRQRGELLDLCQLYLEWNELYRVSLHQCTVIKGEVDAALATYREWVPGTIDPPRTDVEVNDVERSAVVGAAPAASDTRRTSAHARLLDLQDRFDHLSEHDVPSAGILLDRMIDLAAPLKGSGGIPGSKEASEEDVEGAVPTTILDRQDELEALSAQLRIDLAVGHRVGRICTSADTAHKRYVHLHVVSQRSIENIRSHLSDMPIDPDTLSSLSGQLKQAETLGSSDSGFTKLIAESYALVDIFNGDRIVRAIRQDQEIARKGLRDWRASIEWTQRINPIYAEVIGHRETLGLHKGQLLELLDLDISPMTTYRVTNDARSAWLQRADVVLAIGNNIDRDQEVRLSVTKYRAMLRARPEVLRSSSVTGMDVCDTEVDALMTETSDLRAGTIVRCRELRRARELQERIAELTVLAEQSNVRLQSLDDILQTDIEASLWPRSNMCNPVDFERWQDSQQMVWQVIRAEIDPKLQDVHTLATIHELEDPHARSTLDLIDSVKRKARIVDSMLTLLGRIRIQNTVVREVQQETEDLLSQLRAATGCSASQLVLRQDINNWEAGLSARVLFISQIKSTPVRSIQQQSRGDLNALLTPPPSPIPTPLDHQRWNLAGVDRAVREEVNRQTARVRSLLEQIDRQRPSDPNGDRRDLELHVPLSELSIEGMPDALHNTDDQKILLGDAYPAQALDSPSIMPMVAVPSSTTRLSDDKNGSSSTGLPKSASRSSLGLGSRSTLHHARDRDRNARRPTTRPDKSTSRSTPRKYVPKVNHQLDQAVGQIVNSMSIHVPITPVGDNEPHEWTDITGSYWIGAEGRAKLCYCRILRSQTVMVRVGGGWVELSKFLADHFAERITTPETVQSGSTPVTPDRFRPGTVEHTIGTEGPPIGRQIATQAILSRSSSSDRPLSIATDGPLTPLRFMRKASDSPDDRKKEKDKLKVGRRSILGKEP